jgi:hypothetical protein
MNFSYQDLTVQPNYDKNKALVAVYVFFGFTVLICVYPIWKFVLDFKAICVSGLTIKSIFKELWSSKTMFMLFFDLFSDLDYCRKLLNGEYVSKNFQIPLSMLIILLAFQITGMINAIFLTIVLDVKDTSPAQTVFLKYRPS